MESHCPVTYCTHLCISNIEKLQVQTSNLNNAQNTQAKNPGNKQHAVSSYPSPTLLSWEIKSQVFSAIGRRYSDTTYNVAE